MATMDLLPECAVRRCRIWMTYDVEHMRRVYQHGERPEAVLLIGNEELLQPGDPNRYLVSRVRMFTEACHRYEEPEPAEGEAG